MKLSVNVVSFFIICGNREIGEWQCSLFLVILSEKLANFWLISHEIAKTTGIGHGFHNLELKWNMISWNAKHCFRAWIFRECEFTDPSLVCRIFGLMEEKERMKMHVVVVLKVKWSTIAFLKASSQEKEKSLIYFIGLP